MSTTLALNDSVLPLDIQEEAKPMKYCRFCGVRCRATINGVNTCADCLRSGKLLRFLFNRSHR